MVEATKAVGMPFIERVKAIREADDSGGLRSRSSEDWEITNRHKQLEGRFGELKKSRGRRYEQCSFQNYHTQHSGQRRVIESLESFAKADRCKESNVLLIGPKGAGKDHMLMALSRCVAYFHGIAPYWINGVDLHQRLRDQAFGEDRHSGSGGYSDLRKTEILWISDPLPPSGVLTEFQQAALFGVIDYRYSNMLPTWLTLNVASGAEAGQRMGAQVVDRLQHGALIENCNWPSYREPARGDE